MERKIVKELLTRNPKTFKALHALYDFDFKADFEVVKINGRFTHNSIKKALSIPEFYGYNVAAIITNVKYNEKYNYIVKAVESGFCLDFSRNVWGSEYNIDHFWGKGNFESARKEENIITYIVCQKSDLAKKASEKKPDFTQRFQYVRVTRWSDGKGKHGISQIDVCDKMHNNKKFTYRTRRPESSENVNYFLDKSGYFVEEKKEELKRRAKALRTEREKAAADASDFNKEVNEHFERMQAIRKNISERVLNAVNFDLLCDADRILSAARWLQISLDRFKKCNIEKGFRSIESANNALNAINAEFEKIETMLSPV